MNLRIFLISGFLILIQLLSFSQTITLKGVIRDEQTGDKLPFVNIGMEGRSAGTYSDEEGHYRIELSKGEHTLVFSCVGYEKLEKHIRADGHKPIILDIRMKSVSQELNTVVVSASKYAQKIQESISSIEVIRAKSIETGNLPTADKAIDKMPGITIVNNEPQIRGGSGFSSGLGSRVMIMVDEIPILRGDAGRPDWALLPIDDIDQIELVKGASSVVFGSSAINGAVNIRTSWPKEEPSTKITSFLGIYSKPIRKYTTPWTGGNPLVYGLSVTHAQQIGVLDIAGGVTYFNDQGYIGGTPEGKVSDTVFNKGAYANRIKFYFNTRVRSKKIDGLTYGLNGNFMVQENAENYFWYDADTNIYRSFPGSLSRFKQFTGYLDPFVKYYAPNGDVHSLKNRVYYLNSDGLYNQTALSVTVFNEYQYSHKFKKAGDLLLVTGITNIYGYSYGKVFSGQLAADGTPTLGANGSYSSENLAVYAQLEKKFFNKLTFLLGGRFEYYHLADLTESKPVFRAGLNYQAFKASYFRLAVGQGYRVPSIGERYITTTSGNFGFYPNPDLASETSISYEVGFKQLFRVGKFGGMFDIAGFYEDYEKYVEFNFGYWGMNLTNPTKNVGFKFFNTGPARIYGIDLSAVGEGKLFGDVNLSAMAGYTYSIPQAKDPDYIFYNNPYNPKNSLNYLNTSSDTNGYILKYRVQSLLKADLQVTWKRISIGFGGRYYGFMKNIDKFFEDVLDGQMFGVKTGIKKYREEHNTGTMIVDFRASYALRHFKFSCIINNMFNTEFSLRPLTVEPMRMSQFQVIYKI